MIDFDNLLDNQYFFINLLDNLMNLTLRQLNAFLVVHKTGSFTKAAEELHLTQSALSGLIKELENNIGLRLFDRTTRQLQLSENGKNLLPYASKVINEMSNLSDEIESLKNLEKGRIRIGITQQLASTEFPNIIAKFNQKYPNIEVFITDSGVEKIQELVENSEVDFGIGPERLLTSGLRREFFFSLPFTLVCPPTHLYAKKPFISWQEIDGNELITLNGPFTDLINETLLKSSVKKSLKTKHKVNYMSTALSMVKSGLGTTLCLPYVREWVNKNHLVMLPIKNPVIYRRFFLYFRKDRELSPATKEFIKVFLFEIRMARINKLRKRN